METHKGAGDQKVVELVDINGKLVDPRKVVKSIQQIGSGRYGDHEAQVMGGAAADTRGPEWLRPPPSGLFDHIRETTEPAIGRRRPWSTWRAIKACINPPMLAFVAQMAGQWLYIDKVVVHFGPDLTPLLFFAVVSGYLLAEGIALSVEHFRELESPWAGGWTSSGRRP